MNKITQRARELRNNMTESEALLWRHIRSRQLGVKFLRQKPLRLYDGDRLRYFIADFCCPEKKLVIEVDGGIHAEQKEYDEMRTSVINELGYSVIRFNNDEIKYHIEKVIEKLETLLKV